MSIPKRILPLIVLSQFCCTSLWFAGNGVMVDLKESFHLADSALGHLTSAVQLGFIAGTLLFALLTLSDRYAPSRVFFISALAASVFNLGIVYEHQNLISLISLRFMTGFFLAGIYPVGMKIAADYYDKGLGKSLGYLVGALVLGTAFPHLLRGVTEQLPWRPVILCTSALAAFGGIIMFLFVPNGPFRSKGQNLDFTAFFRVFKNRKFRSAAFGYFGHMWELYAFWAFVPIMINEYLHINQSNQANTSLYAFLIIGLGGLACVFGGYISSFWGTKKTATTFLLLSGICCILSPLFFLAQSFSTFIFLLLFWGLVVIADSPLFSTLVAQNAPPEIKGTALTIVNCIGFSITIISIQVLTYLFPILDTRFLFLILALGPIFGIFALTNPLSLSRK